VNRTFLEIPHDLESQQSAYRNTLRWTFVMRAIAALVFSLLAAGAADRMSHPIDRFMTAISGAMKEMDRDMAAAPMTGSADLDFASMMTPHHKGAIDMAKVELSFGKDPVMLRLAQEIIVDQQSEIDAMRLWLRKNGPAGTAATAMSGDRVYTADQTSNTVSVIDPATNRLLGSIHLGEDVPAALLPLYRGELLVHGLGFSPDHKTLDVVSIGSNSVTLIDTETNTVKGRITWAGLLTRASFDPMAVSSG
jgi:YVTN family beta-propeller protein